MKFYDFGCDSQIDTIRSTLRNSPNGPKVHILIDYLRGTRRSHDGRSSVTLLSELAHEFPDKVQLSLFQFPSKNVLRRLFPPRFNEAFGLMHMKAYAFDDTVIVSGYGIHFMKPFLSKSLPLFQYAYLHKGYPFY
jgi:CDP-diacylglycerol--glycerol-3-phosphate 3-phosphatidyltransferase